MTSMNTFGALIIAGLALPAASALAAQSYDAHALVLKDVTGRVHVRTASVDRISVDIDPGAGVVDAPRVSVRDGAVLVRGNKYRHVRCSVRDHKVRLGVARFGIGKKHKLADFPTVTVTVPQGSSLKISGGRVFGEAGDLAQADVQVNGCGNFSLGAVAGDLEAQLNGSGDLAAGTVGGDADAQLNGSGDLTIGDVSGDADAQVNGSGDLRLGDIGGEAEAQVNGSGDLYLGAANGGLDAQVNGSGDIHVAFVQGPVHASINGSGDIVIKGGTATPFAASIIGSGDVAFHGHANGVDARVTGSGDITLASYEGEFRASRHGVHVIRE